jgi:hypothetical protein
MCIPRQSPKGVQSAVRGPAAPRRGNHLANRVALSFSPLSEVSKPTRRVTGVSKGHVRTDAPEMN